MSQEMEEKKLRLFGFEVHPHARPSDHESTSSSSTNSIIHEDKSINEEKQLRLFGFEVIDSHVHPSYHESTSSSSTTSIIIHEEKSINDEKQVQCQFCHKKFTNSQALGGHQNAHKKERLKSKRLQMQDKRALANLSYYMQSHQSQGYAFGFMGSSAASFFFNPSYCAPNQFTLNQQSPASFKLASDSNQVLLPARKEKFVKLGIKRG